MTQIIEQNMNGLDGLIYMSSTSDASGRATITLTFENGTNPDIAQVQVQNKLQLAMPLLPQMCSSRASASPSRAATSCMVVGFVSDDGSMTPQRHRRLRRSPTWSIR